MTETLFDLRASSVVTQTPSDHRATTDQGGLVSQDRGRRLQAGIMSA
jgi:hypothetical protein